MYMEIFNFSSAHKMGNLPLNEKQPLFDTPILQDKKQADDQNQDSCQRIDML